MQMDDILRDTAEYSATTLNSSSSCTSRASPEMQFGVSGARCCVTGACPDIEQERNDSPVASLMPQQRQQHQEVGKKKAAYHAQ